MSKSSLFGKEKIFFDCFLYGIYAALIPFNMVLNISGKGTINKYVGIITVILMIFVCVVKRKQLNTNINKLPLTPIILFTYCIITAPFSVNVDSTFSKIITFASLLLMFFTACLRNFSKKELIVIFVFMVIGACIVPFLLSINYTSSYSRQTLTSSYGVADQNGLAVNMSICFLVSLYLISYFQKKVLKALFCISCAIILVGIVLLGSRGALFSLAVSFFIYILIKMPSLIKKTSFWFTLLLLISILFIFVPRFIGGLDKQLIDRFSLTSIINDGWGGRLEIWSNLFTVLFSGGLRFAFGYGVGTEHFLYSLNFGASIAAHNVFLELFLELGIIGFLMLLAIIWSFFIRTRRSNEPITYAFLSMILMTFLNLGYFYDKGCWNAFFIITALSSFYKRKETGGGTL